MTNPPRGLLRGLGAIKGTLQGIIEGATEQLLRDLVKNSFGAVLQYLFRRIFEGTTPRNLY